MQLDEKKLRRIIHKSIKESFENDPRTKELRDKLDKQNAHADKIKTQLKSFDRNFIIQAYQICEAMPDLDFQEIVRKMIVEMLDGLNNGVLYDRVMTYVSNLLEVLHSNKRDVFYIEDENIENDVQMEFVFKTVTDIMKNLEDYYVEYFTSIGRGL